MILVDDDPPLKRKYQDWLATPPKRRKIGDEAEVLVAPRRRRVVVGRHNLNVLNQPPEVYLGFLYRITPDCDARGRWLLDFEWLEERWAARAWHHLVTNNDGQKLLALVAGRDFHTVFANANRPERELFYKMHRTFVAMMASQDRAPVGLLHALMPAITCTRRPLQLTGWYELLLEPPLPYFPFPSYDLARSRFGVFSPHAADYRADPAPTYRRVWRMRRVHPDQLQVLRALHYPQADPASYPVQQDDDDDMGMPPGSPFDGGVVQTFRGASPRREEGRRRPPPPPAPPAWRSALDSAVDWVRSLLDGLPSLAPELALAGGGVLPGDLASPRPVKLEERGDVPRADPILHVGSPLAAPLGLQIANPMHAGGQQAFVGMFNMGQGNLNILYGNNGRVIAYYDFGTPVNTHLATAPVYQAPCVHDDPIIILSQWDYDHIGMARQQQHCWSLRWIVPEQNVGSASALDVYQNILNDPNGAIYLWPQNGVGPAFVPAAEHLPLPWGYIERGLRARQANFPNEGGLAMYVCVRDAPGGPPASPGRPVLAAPFTGRVGPPDLVQPRAAATLMDNTYAPLLDPMRWTAQATAIAAGELATVSGAPAPAPLDIVFAAEAAVRAGGNWAARLAALAAPAPPSVAVGPLTAAAAALNVALGGFAGQPTAAAAVAAAELAAGGSITGLPGLLFTATDLGAVVAMVDAAATGGSLALETAAAQTAAGAVAALAAFGWIMPAAGTVVAANLAGATADTDAHRFIQWSRAAANGGACVSAEVAALAVGPLAAANALQMQCAAEVAVRHRMTVGGAWANLLAAMNGAVATTGLVGTAAGQLGALAPGATCAASVLAQNGAAAGVVAGLAAGGTTLVHLAVAAAIADAAEAATLGGLPVDVGLITGAARAAGFEVANDGGVLLAWVPAPLNPGIAYAAGGAGAFPGGALPLPYGGGGGAVAGHAPFHAGERYVVLTGDVPFEYIPTPRQPIGGPGPVAPPAVVGLVSSHHGSVSSFNQGNAAVRASSKVRVPWAPGSSAAAACAGAAGAGAVIGGGVASVDVRRGAAAAAGYWAAEAARGALLANPAVAASHLEIGRCGDTAAEIAVGGATWLVTLRGVALPPAGHPHGGFLSSVAARLRHVLGALMGPPATAAGALAAAGGGGLAPVVQGITSAQLVAAGCITDGARAVLVPAPVGIAVTTAAGVLEVGLGVAYAGPSPAATLAGAAANLAAALLGPNAQSIAQAVAIACHDLTVSAGGVAIAAAVVQGVLAAGIGAVGGGWAGVLGAVAGVGGGNAVSAAANALNGLGLAGATLAAAMSATAIGAIPGAGHLLDAVAAAAAVVDAIVAEAAGGGNTLTAARDAAATSFAVFAEDDARQTANLAGHAGNVQQVAAKVAKAAARTAFIEQVLAVPAAAIAASANAAIAAGGAWTAILEATCAPNAPAGLAQAAAALAGAVGTSGAGSLQAAAGALPGLTVQALRNAPNVAHVAAVTGAVDAAVALAAALPGAATSARLAADAAHGSANAASVALGFPALAQTQIWPGVGAGNAYHHIPRATVRAAIEADQAILTGAGGGLAAIRDASFAHARSVVSLPAVQTIGHSYGVVAGPGGAHCYPTLPGPHGHPHPDAVIEYASRGWTQRMNTSTDAWQSAQPDPFPAVLAAAGGGHAAFGCTLAGQPLPGDVGTPGLMARGPCPLCSPLQFRC